MIAARGRLRLAPRLLALAGVFYAFAWISGFPRTYDDDELPPDVVAKKAAATAVPFPVEVDKLVVTIKTTAIDAYAKLPTNILFTPTMYHDNLVLGSDLRMDIGAFHVEDLLDRYDKEFLGEHEELGRYGRQLNFALRSIDLSLLKDEDEEEERMKIAKLDKYKYLRMLERAWELRPDRHWYVFVDPETYLVRPSLMEWLGQYDPTEPIFFANPPELDASESSGTGSATFILSAQAMRALLVDREDVLTNWDSRISDFQTGFEVLASALSSEISLGFNRSWPGISGFNPYTVPYGPGLWCEHVMAMHHVPPELQSDLWRLLRDREERDHAKEPLTFADLWTAFLQTENLYLDRENWDNLSGGRENARWNILFESARSRSHVAEHMRHHLRDEDGRAESGEDSWEACRESCSSNDFCMQWSYSSTPISNHNENGETRCHLSRHMRLGRHVEPKEIEGGHGRVKLEWKSGWRKDKFVSWSEQQRCKGQQNKI
jgi:hypothetical protein